MKAKNDLQRLENGIRAILKDIYGRKIPTGGGGLHEGYYRTDEEINLIIDSILSGDDVA